MFNAFIIEDNGKTQSQFASGLSLADADAICSRATGGRRPVMA